MYELQCSCVYVYNNKIIYTYIINAVLKRDLFSPGMKIQCRQTNNNCDDRAVQLLKSLTTYTFRRWCAWFIVVVVVLVSRCIVAVR